MKTNTLTADQIKVIKKFQEDEITGRLTYLKLADTIKNSENAEIVRRIADDEKRHYDLLKKYTHTEVAPNYIKIWWYFILTKLLGITFGIKLLERNEDKAQRAYEKYLDVLPELKKTLDDEEEHEQQLINLINEERLKYVGSVVLGLNDALVELTGSLAGFSLAMQNAKLIAMAGLITGIAASFSMAASDYLSQKADDGGKDALKSSLYTGGAYIVTVALLILPYLLISNYMVCLGIALTVAILIILAFNYYIAIAKDLNFKRRFSEMAIISLGVAAFSFFVGFVVKNVFDIDI
jgi:VIT1/CCC1 family predicted Fe2+/Mn2+ transporter